ncbi:RNA polymerase sigma factor [Hyphococcus sp.]|uniref:RNA polymerase sigma factor n=1 Tax=Hyphococcus sp. TaxID=2038636 RepID=UPI00208C1B12|nr:MAG: RNA polymerase sigma factor [Marinicaulis sp.]
MELNDIELVAMAKAGDERRAFATLVRRHQGKLRAFLLRLCGDNALADDIAQATFMKAHIALAGFTGGGSFRSWLFAIAYRELLQDVRKNKAATRLEETLKAEPPPQNSQDMEAGMSLDLRRALSSLDEMERASILLCDAAGFSHSEAAAALDAPLGSVKTYLARARENMRAFLSAEHAPPNAKTPVRTTKGTCYAI